jgi:hypothetical protein
LPEIVAHMCCAKNYNNVLIKLELTLHELYMSSSAKMVHQLDNVNKLHTYIAFFQSLQDYTIFLRITHIFHSNKNTGIHFAGPWKKSSQRTYSRPARNHQNRLSIAPAGRDKWLTFIFPKLHAWNHSNHPSPWFPRSRHLPSKTLSLSLSAAPVHKRSKQ